MNPLGILGGTFDPIHCGHLRLALEMRAQLGLEEVALVPAADPPHRETPLVEAALRLRMLEAAVAGVSGLTVDDRELHRSGPSFTVDTLTALRERFPQRPLCLILGMDAFATLDSWHQWREIPRLAHIGVARRPGAELPAGGAVAELLATRRREGAASLVQQPAGFVLVRDIPALDISATQIRALFAAGGDTCCLLPEPVARIIKDQSLYRCKQR